MNNHKGKRLGVPLAVLTLTTGAVLDIARAEDDEVADLINPQSTVRAGVGYVNRDNLRFGQYTGLNEKGAYGLLDVDLVRRDDATGTWTRVTGRDLGLDSRELRFEHDRQGDWGYFIDYSQIPRFNPYHVNTGLSGIGTPNVTVNGTPLRDVSLKTERERVTFGFGKSLAERFSFDVRFRNEEKQGARMFGRGTTGAAGFQFLADPIDYTTQQLESTLSYTGDKLQVSGGYYGTMFDNRNRGLNVSEAVPSGLATFTPIGLPPDNQSHQLFVEGGYNFTQTTRGTFKIAYARQTQDDTFVVPAAPATGRTDLGGRVDTTLLQAGITARPLPKLSLLANLRYEDRDDKTPVVDYFPTIVVTTSSGENEPRSIKTVVGKVEAAYQLPADFRVTVGVAEESKKRNTSSVRIVSFREETEETSYRVELRRSMSETVTGAVAYIRSDRTGSDFQTTTLTTGAAGSNLIAPIHLADRERDKVRLSVNWAPTEPLSLQFIADSADDDYEPRTALGLGPRSGEAKFYSVDAAYAFSEDWQGTAWVSRNDNRIDQASAVGASAAAVWEAKLRNVGNAIGLGLRGKPTSKIEAGFDVQYSSIRDEYWQAPIAPSTATAAPLPDVRTRLTTVRLHSRYALEKNSAVGVEYVYDRYRTDEWIWNSFTYTDGTRVTEDPKQKASFVGVSYYQRW